MYSSNSVRRIRLNLGILLLLLAVFGWGVQYKTSLYAEQVPSHHSEPPAKLLSEAERADAAQAVVCVAVKNPELQHAAAGRLCVPIDLEPRRDDHQNVVCIFEASSELRPPVTTYLRGPPRRS
jgi:hypothetical protein